MPGREVLIAAPQLRETHLRVADRGAPTGPRAQVASCRHPPPPSMQSASSLTLSHTCGNPPRGICGSIFKSLPVTPDYRVIAPGSKENVLPVIPASLWCLRYEASVADVINAAVPVQITSGRRSWPRREIQDEAAVLSPDALRGKPFRLPLASPND